MYPNILCVLDIKHGGGLHFEVLEPGFNQVFNSVEHLIQVKVLVLLCHSSDAVL